MTAIYPYPWPIGTCHFRELPENIQSAMQVHLTNGVVTDPELIVHRTPTEGAYVSFAGWKIRATVEPSGPTTWIVRLA